MSAAQRDKGAPAKVCANCGRTGELGYRVNRNGATVCTRADVCRRRRSNAATPRLSAVDYAARLEAQGGGCALCGTKPKTRRLDIDHDHRTGEVRGLLCHRCNRALPSWISRAWLWNAVLYLDGIQQGSFVRVPVAPAFAQLDALLADLAAARAREQRLREAFLDLERNTQRHMEDCCRSDIGWREQMTTHNAASCALDRARAALAAEPAADGGQIVDDYRRDLAKLAETQTVSSVGQPPASAAADEPGERE